MTPVFKPGDLVRVKIRYWATVALFFLLGPYLIVWWMTGGYRNDR